MYPTRFDQSLFRDREDAGIRLASALAPLLSQVKPRDLVVLGMVRGGIPVAFEIARRFAGTLDACTVRKIGVPGQPELAIGAVGPGRSRNLNDILIHDLRLTPEMIHRLSLRAADERDRIDAAVRDGRAPGSGSVSGRVVVLADDGLATGASMRAALVAVAKQHPLRIIVAVPVAPPEITNELRAQGIETVALIEPESFRAVGHWYVDFASVSLATVRTMLETGSRPISTPGRA